MICAEMKTVLIAMEKISLYVRSSCGYEKCVTEVLEENRFADMKSYVFSLEKLRYFRILIKFVIALTLNKKPPIGHGIA